MSVYNLILLFVYLVECSAIINKSKDVDVKDSNQSGSEYRTRNTGRVRFQDDYDDYDTGDVVPRGRQRIKFDGPVHVGPDTPTSVSYVRREIPVIGYRRDEPNVQVESTYRNVKRTSGPVYKQVIVTEVQDDGSRQPRPRNTAVPRRVAKPKYVPREPRQQDRSHTEYASKTTVKFPDGYARGENKRMEERSQYKQDSRLKQAYKKIPIVEVGTSPQVQYTKPVRNLKVVKNQPLEEASSSFGEGYVSEEVDDGAYVDGGLVENYGGGYDRGRHFEKEGGKKYSAGHHAVEGVKGDKGYKGEHAYEKGESAKHGAEENKGELSESEGAKKSHIDTGSKFAEGHKKAEGAKVDNFVHKTGHKKGHKKSGFHRVHHKDEYKNDEEFFDEEIDSGEEQKHGHSHVHHGQAEGESEKAGHHDSAYLEKQSGQKGEEEKGHKYNQEEGFKGEKGHESHYADNSEFSKKGGHKEGEVHKHSDIGGGSILY